MCEMQSALSFRCGFKDRREQDSHCLVLEKRDQRQRRAKSTSLWPLQPGSSTVKGKNTCVLSFTGALKDSERQKTQDNILLKRRLLIEKCQAHTLSRIVPGTTSLNITNEIR